MEREHLSLISRLLREEIRKLSYDLRTLEGARIVAGVEEQSTLEQVTREAYKTAEGALLALYTEL